VGLPANSHPANAAQGGLIIHATDFSFAVSDPSVTPGPVHIQFLNDSKDIVHEVFVFPSNQPKLDEFLAEKGAGKEVTEGEFLRGLAGGVEDVDPGHSIAFDVTLSEGTYTLACFVSSTIAGKDTIHYELGMHATLPVSSVAAPAPVPAAPAPRPVVVKAPNTGAGPASGGSDAGTAIALLVIAGALALGSGAAVRVGLSRRGTV
jgi:uncharacterized cupredoxin-like copper-binding protein